MKSLTRILLVMALALVTACSSNDLYDELPSSIASFISQYFPNTKIESYTPRESGYTVVLKDGPGLSFDKQYFWTSIDGYGSPLPQVLVFDQFPPDLYDYLQTTGQTENVFSAIRNSRTYIVKLLNNTISYDIETGQVAGASSQQQQ